MSSLTFLNLGSGSKGNATLFVSEGKAILIDMGIGIRQLEAGLKILGVEKQDLIGCFVTHIHSDHTKGLRYLHCPIYAREGAIDGICEYTPLSDFYPYTDFSPFTITLLPTSHDAPSPCGYLIETNGIKFAYVTDTGRLKKDTLKMLVDCDAYIFESNHDLDMLEKSGRPRMLKNRIKGTKGHMNNVQSAGYLASLVGPHTKAAFLAHISEECNTPEIALAAHKAYCEEKGIYLDTLWQYKDTLYSL